MAPSQAHGRAAGSALVLALLIAFIVSLLGISFLMMSETERRIARNERYATLALYAAESGTRLVKRWFDRPEAFIHFPAVSVTDRDDRLLVDETDPHNPLAYTTANGSSVPYYKQGRDLDGDGLDLFERPWNGDDADRFLGAETGPDIRIDDRSSAAVDYLRQLSQTLFGPAYQEPGPVSGPNAVTVRIVRIDVYAPPYRQTAAGWRRFGIATVKVVARVYQGGPTGSTLGEAEIRAVVGALPYGSLRGPLHSCRGLDFRGGPPFTARWGSVTAVGDARISAGLADIALGLPRVVPPITAADRLWPDDSAQFLTFQSAMEDQFVQDPWSRVFAGGQLAFAPAGVQPWPPPASPATFIPPAPPDPADPCCDRSHLFQTFAGVACPRYDYAVWKSAALEGGADATYWAHAGGTTFKENGTGPARSFYDITRDARGLHFFDTADGLPPTDADADGLYENLTSPIVISGGDWAPRGFLFLNAVKLTVDGVTGVTRSVAPPAEPFHDANGNGVFDSGEGYLNLVWPTAVGDPTEIDGDGSSGPIPVWEPRGPAFDAEVSMHGILYTNGYFEATGQATWYGSVVSHSGVVQGSNPFVVGTPTLLWDAGLAADWPPGGFGLPLVVLSGWSTRN